MRPAPAATPKPAPPAAHRGGARPLHHDGVPWHHHADARRAGRHRRRHDLPALSRQGRAAERRVPAGAGLGRRHGSRHRSRPAASGSGPPARRGSADTRGVGAGARGGAHAAAGAGRAPPRRAEPRERAALSRGAAAGDGERQVGWCGAGRARPICGRGSGSRSWRWRRERVGAGEWTPDHPQAALAIEAAWDAITS